MEYRPLADELAGDPAGLGYAGKTGAQCAALLNAVNQVIERETIPAWEVLEATVPAEYAALSAAEKTRYGLFVGAGDVNVKGTNTRAAFAVMFGAGTQTRANLLALQTRLDSRANVIGLGGMPTARDVDIARSGVW